MLSNLKIVYSSTVAPFHANAILDSLGLTARGSRPNWQYP